MSTRTEITQQSWIDAILETWEKKFSIGAALMIAAKIPLGTKLSTEQWISLHRSVLKFRPKLREHHYIGQQVSVFIAEHYIHANDCLYDGKIELARKWILSGKDCKRGTPKNAVRRALTKEFGTPSQNGKNHFSFVRELNTQKTNWSKCK